MIVTFDIFTVRKITDNETFDSFTVYQNNCQEGKKSIVGKGVWGKNYHVGKRKSGSIGSMLACCPRDPSSKLVSYGNWSEQEL